MRKIKEVLEFERKIDENNSVFAFLIIDWKNNYVILSCPIMGNDAIQNVNCIKASTDAKVYADNCGMTINEYISH